MGSVIGLIVFFFVGFVDFAYSLAKFSLFRSRFLVFLESRAVLADS